MIRSIFKIVSIIFLTGIVLVTRGQETRNLPRVFLFTDRAYCVSGDSVWFKVQLKNGIKSKGNVVHVQLDSPDNRLISTVIKKSRGGWTEGFLPVPDSLSTGVYFVSAFLNAQKNVPALKIQNNALFVYNRFDDDVSEMEIPATESRLIPEDYSGKIRVETNKAIFAPREKVAVHFDSEPPVNSEITEVVVKASMVDPAAQKNGGLFLFETKAAESTDLAAEENDGFILSGKVTDSDSGKQQAGLIVLLSITTEIPYFDYCVPDSNGKFRFFLKNAEGQAEIYLQAATPGNRQVAIELENNYLERKNIIRQERKILSVNETEFVADAIDGSFFDRLFRPQYAVEISTFNMPARFSVPFYGEPKSRVIPAEFIGLSDFREISRELLHGIQYRDRHDEITIRVLNEEQGRFFEHEPLRLLNGIPVFDNRLLKPLNSADIEYIDYVFKEQLFGDLVFKGVLAVSLTDKSNSWLVRQPGIFRFRVPCFQVERAPAYLKFKVPGKNFPDTRKVFYWKNMQPDQLKNIEFNLSDVKGMVEISVEGVSPDNKIFKSSKMVEVK